MKSVITAISLLTFSLHGVHATICDVCVCSSTNEMFCQDRNLDVIPSGIPINTIQLHLYGNNISTIEKGYLDGLSSLQRLRLDDNVISSVENGSLDGLSSLESLNLKGIKLTTLEYGAFVGLTSLKILYMSDNNITFICNKTFTGLTNVNLINLRRNSIRSICRGTFAELTNLRRIEFDDNENTMECCEVHRFITWIQQNPSIEVGGKCKHLSQPTLIQTFNVSECPPPIYGGWNDFGPWGVCSKTCGGGQQSRTRTCTNPSPAYGGDECQGSSQEIISCQEQHCPVDGGWTDFGPWGVCSKTCGGGLQSRTRTCTNPSPAYGGNECQESNQETQSCQEQHCPVDGGLTDFGPWGVCSKTCGGGLQSRTRTCTNPSPAYGGNECQESNQETQSCQEQHCPVDGGWTDFGPWGVCSKTCGGGLQSRTRTCTNPSPANGGNECQESNQETQSCQEQHCPVPSLLKHWFLDESGERAGLPQRSRRFR